MSFWDYVWSTAIGFTIGGTAAEIVKAAATRSWLYLRYARERRRWRKSNSEIGALLNAQQGAVLAGGKVFTGLKGGR